MATTDMNIPEIVYVISFSSQSYFSKIFRNKYEISPTAFKKKQPVEEETAPLFE